ncbi:hypothetical protein LDENG_00004580 [Lucifuga dentata]|nr:hypothetical protein LDENG_00004580 [Lucifuga dentata]
MPQFPGFFSVCVPAEWPGCRAGDDDTSRSAPAQTRSSRSFHSSCHSEHSSHLCQCLSWLSLELLEHFGTISKTRCRKTCCFNASDGALWKSSSKSCVSP